MCDDMVVHDASGGGGASGGAAGRWASEASAAEMLQSIRHSMGVLRPKQHESPGKATRERIYNEQVQLLQEVDLEKRKAETRERRRFRQSLAEHQERVKLIGLHGRDACIPHSTSMPSLPGRPAAVSASSSPRDGLGRIERLLVGLAQIDASVR